MCFRTCSVVGEGHFQTFDGKLYTFAGPCQYVLAEASNNAFSIDVETVLCGSSGITCTRAIDIHIGNITIFMVKGSEISVNNVQITLPKYYNDLRIEQSGVYYIVTSDIGLKVKWDLGTRLYVEVDPLFNSLTSGLCGNYDTDQTNDFTTRTGLVEQSSENFANSWQVLNNCPDVEELSLDSPCELHPERKAWAMRHCNIILHSTFEECHSKVEPEPYFDRCTYDACGCDYGGDCECLCTAVAAYAQECNDAGVYIKWRSQDLCPMQCESGLEYMACGPTCRQTCDTISGEDPLHCSECVEGCHCPHGYVAQDEGCVLADECPCVYENGEYPPGTVITKECQNW
ncbi:mucin-2-like [Antedon mediterranea]|uniref:mucin-2-like n=1 Tax=Antedon mediterranea TaxID=105859 RepID=UPI003AF6068B